MFTKEKLTQVVTPHFIAERENFISVVTGHIREMEHEYGIEVDTEELFEKVRAVETEPFVLALNKDYEDSDSFIDDLTEEVEKYITALLVPIENELLGHNIGYHLMIVSS